MKTDVIIAELDAEIAKLQQARALLVGEQKPKKRGRPAGGSTSSKATSFNPAEFASTPKKKRVVSAETRAKMAEKQKARWAKVKKAASTRAHEA